MANREKAHLSCGVSGSHNLGHVLLLEKLNGVDIGILRREDPSMLPLGIFKKYSMGIFKAPARPTRFKECIEISYWPMVNKSD